MEEYLPMDNPQDLVKRRRKKGEESIRTENKRKRVCGEAYETRKNVKKPAKKRPNIEVSLMLTLFEAQSWVNLIFVL